VLTSRRWRRVRRALAAALALVVVAAGALVLRLLNPSDVRQSALAAVTADPDLTLVQEDGYVAPLRGTVREAVVFYLGGHAAVRAYVPTWAPVVAATGTMVLIPDVPSSLAYLDSDAAEPIMADWPDVAQWWLGGHSMDGFAATEYLASHPGIDVGGLALWAASPGGDVDPTVSDERAHALLASATEDFLLDAGDR